MPLLAPVPQLAIYMDYFINGAHCDSQQWFSGFLPRWLGTLTSWTTSHSEGSHPLPSPDERQGSGVPLRQQLHCCLPPEPEGMLSLPMFHLSWDIPLLSQQHGISLSVRHIPSRLNVLADSLSRKLQIIGTEWFLHPGILCQMFSIWYIPELDLFCNSQQSQAAHICVSSFQIPGQ